MPRYVQLVPNGPGNTPANWSIEAGDGASPPPTLWQTVADTLPVRGGAGPGNPWTRVRGLVLADPLRLTFSTYTLLANERVRRVRSIVYGQTNGANMATRFGQGTTMVGGTGAQPTELLGRLDFWAGWNIQEIKVGPWVPRALTNTAGVYKDWEQADINDLRAEIFTYMGNAFSAIYLYDIKLELEIVTEPEAQIIEPAANAVVAGRPRLSWNQTGQTEPQLQFEYALFREETVNAGGFNPDTTVAVVRGRIASSASFVDLPQLPYGDGVNEQWYQAYVRLAADYNGNAWWGDWTPGRRFRMQSRPVVDVTGPVSGSVIIDSATPEVAWLYDDLEGDAQSFYLVNVYERPGTSWTGFDPDSTAAAAQLRWTSDWVASKSTNVTVGPLKDGGQFRAYVKAAQSLPVRLESAWDYTEFSTDFATPAVPSAGAGAAGHTMALFVTPGTPPAGTKGVTSGFPGSWVETADHANLDNATDFDYRFRVGALDWTPDAEQVIASKWEGGLANCSWFLSLRTDGRLRFVVSISGTEGGVKEYVSSVATGLTAGAVRWIRVQHDNNNPATDTTVTFALSTDNTTYTTLGTAQVLDGIENVYNSSAPVRLGVLGASDPAPFRGYIERAELRSSVGGTVVANPDFSARPLGNASFADAAGRTWTFVGNAEVENKETPNADGFDVRRSLDGGVTWEEDFRLTIAHISSTLSTSSQNIPKNGTSTVVIVDHEVPLKKAVSYQARAWAQGLGTKTVSDWSASTTATISNISTVQIKDTVDTSDNASFPVDGRWITATKRRMRTSYEPLGRTKSVVVKRDINYVRFNLVLTILGDDKKAALDDIINRGNKLFVQTPKGSWWMEIISDVAEEMSMWDDLRNYEQAWMVNLQLQEVDQ